MPRELYVQKDFRAERLALIEKANSIIEEFQAQGFTLTLRQLYYQFVARALLPNTEKSYGKLGTTINAARLAGMLDWDAIEDRTRYVRHLATWTSPAEIVQACSEQYRIDLWDNQKVRCEVWIEKDALVGVIEGVCNRYQVDYYACRGYSSQSEQWRAGKRLARYMDRGQGVVVLHLGDHDPSGVDMTRDNQDRLSMFAGAPVEVHRLALNMNQVRRYRPPPNPAKLTDSRVADYLRLYGNKSWELDALDPRVIEQLIESAIRRLIDPVLWDESLARAKVERERLKNAAKALTRTPRKPRIRK